MVTHDPAVFHKLYGVRKARVAYYTKDFADYAVMLVVSALVMGACYGSGHILSVVGFALCAIALAAFIIRHGLEFRVPLILRRPQDVLYMFLYRFTNLTDMYFVALGLLVLEGLLIAATPNLPHHVETMRTVALSLFYVHFLGITAYRTVIAIDHLAKKELVREVLMQTSWSRVINERTSMTFEIVHAYCTGLLTHIVMLAPWYLVIAYARFSVLVLLVACVINVIVYFQWLKRINAWFYRDHWLCHNSELEFLLLHGTHHDAIPSGMIAVAESGILEGFLRFTLGTPVPFLNPVMAFLAVSFEVKQNIDAHQYIPGVFPPLSRRAMEAMQHSTHHYGPIEPYSFAVKVDQPDSSERYQNLLFGLPDELRNSAKLDEELTGFKWDNPTYRRTLRLYDKYQASKKPVH